MAYSNLGSITTKGSGSYYDYVSPNYNLNQSFKPSLTGTDTIRYFQWYGKTVGTIDIYLKNSGGSTLASTTDSESSTGWHTIDFGYVTVSPTSTYYIVFVPRSGGKVYFYYANQSNTYSDGTGYVGTNTSIGGTDKGYDFAISFTCYNYYTTATVGNTSTGSATETSFSASSSISDDGDATVTERGFCYSSSTNPPTTADSKKAVGSGTGSFNTTISGLSPGITYYIRAYAINAAGTSYGAVTSQATTTGLPSVTTGTVSNIDITTATVAGNVTDDHGAAVSTRGICYNTTGNPTIASDKVASGSGEGAFSSNLTSLLPDTTYYAKAYATNTNGTSYGSQVSFDTLTGEPSVTTGSTSSLTKNSVTCAGNVTDDNGSAVTEAGIVYSINENPTTANNKVTTSSGEGAFSEDLTGLSIATLYHYRAYAINSEGTSYGDDETFTTLPAGPSDLTASTSTKTTMSLSWTKGSGADTTIVRRKTGSYPTDYTDGTGVYSGAGTSTTDTSLSAGTTYFYRAWSLDGVSNYSSEYSSATENTIYGLTNPGNVTAADGSYATCPASDGVVYIFLSKDGGTTYSDAKQVTLTGSNTEFTFGNGDTELWGSTWTGDDVDDTSFRLLIAFGTGVESFQIFKTFGFSITSTQILTGIEVKIKGYFDTDTAYLDYLGVNCLYGDSVLPITEGTQAYVTDEDCLAFFDGSNWKYLRSGITQNISILDGDTVTTHNLTFEDGVLTAYSTS